MREIDTLKAAAYNPRRISDHDLQALVRSLKQFGFVDPVIIRGSDSMIVGGHQRVAAAREAGITEAPCIVLDDLSENDAKLLNMALNRISGDWDEDRLADLLAELSESGADLELTGFDPNELEWLEGDGEIPDPFADQNLGDAAIGVLSGFVHRPLAIPDDAVQEVDEWFREVVGLEPDEDGRADAIVRGATLVNWIRQCRD